MDYILGVVLENPKKTFEEQWRGRVEAVLATGFTFVGLMFFQWKFLNLNLWAGLGLAPLVHFGAFQLVSRITTGRTFGIRLSPTARTADEVFDLIFTVAFLFTLLVGCYTVWDVFSSPRRIIPLN